MAPTTADRIRPVLVATYGDGSMVHALADYLGPRIDNYPSWEPGRDRERMILDTCWTWFSGGTTAESVAREIERVLAPRCEHEQAALDRGKAPVSAALLRCHLGDEYLCGFCERMANLAADQAAENRW